MLCVQLVFCTFRMQSIAQQPASEAVDPTPPSPPSATPPGEEESDPTDPLMLVSGIPAEVCPQLGCSICSSEID